MFPAHPCPAVPQPD